MGLGRVVVLSVRVGSIWIMGSVNSVSVLVRIVLRLKLVLHVFRIIN